MKPVGLAVIGFGWMGQAHARSARRLPTHFPDRAYHSDGALVSRGGTVVGSSLIGQGFVAATSMKRVGSSAAR